MFRSWTKGKKIMRLFLLLCGINIPEKRFYEVIYTIYKTFLRYIPRRIVKTKRYDLFQKISTSVHLFIGLYSGQPRKGFRYYLKE